MSDESWFEVRAIVRVRAGGADDAIDLISEALTTAEIPGMFPVGEFSSSETEDPIARARRQRAEA